MTLGSLLPSSFGPHKPIHDRGEHVYHSTSWKGSSKGEKSSQSALSALTLLAFLFFLNILQSCLRDQMASQSPIVIMMTTTTTTTTSETHRQRRDLDDELKNRKGETAQLNQTMPLRNTRSHTRARKEWKGVNKDNKVTQEGENPELPISDRTVQDFQPSPKETL